ncbi:MAG: tetratricopeptide repeat protein [Cyclobacteriaceae bacterium]
MRFLSFVFPFLLYTCFCHTVSQAQQVPDSLNLQLRQATSLEEEVNALNAIFSYYENTYLLPDTALQIALYALQRAEMADYQKGVARSSAQLASAFAHTRYFNFDSIETYLNRSKEVYLSLNDSLGLANAYFNVSQTCYLSDNYPLARQYCERTVEIYDAIGNEEALAQALAFLCDVQNYQGNNALAVKNCMRSLRLMDKLQMEEHKAAVYKTLGSINYDMRSFEQARQYLMLAIEFARKHEKAFELSSAMISMGEVLRETGFYEDAMQYFRQSLSMDRAADDYSGMSYALFNIGKTLILQDENERAINLLEGALEIAEDYDNQHLQAKVSLEMGKAHVNLNLLTEAFDYLNISLNTAKKIGSSSVLQDAYLSMANYYYKAGEPEEALVYFKLHDLEQNRFFEQENARRIAEMEVMYELDKKEQEITLLQQENQIQKLQADERKIVNYGLILGVVLLSGLGMVLYSKNQLKSRANRELEKQKEAINQQKAKIEKQRDEISIKSQLLEESKRDITDSIMYAKRIQLSLLAERGQLKQLFPDSFLFFRPKDIVSGDFYWLHEHDDKVIVAVLDCTGHGVPGAFMTVLANSLLNELVLENTIDSPNTILSFMDYKIRQALHQQETQDGSNHDGLDMAVCIIDRRQSELCYSGARMPLYLSRQGCFETLQPARFSLGGYLETDKSFTNQCLSLQRGDMIYLATDGFQDQFGGPKDKKFMRSHFINLLHELSKKSSAQQSILLEQNFDQWKNGQTQTDDVLVLGIRV